jgi:hypothetical protein
MIAPMSEWAESQRWCEAKDLMVMRDDDLQDGWIRCQHCRALVRVGPPRMVMLTRRVYVPRHLNMAWDEMMAANGQFRLTAAPASASTRQTPGS